MKNKAKLVNLGAYKDKYYHFDFEIKILLEEVKPPNYWSYILVPITVYVLRFLMTGIEKLVYLKVKYSETIGKE
ncbi:hypothetical protein QM894_05185 [Streptococcus cristatus]|uniref:hypothetical protein n=1 Tax=Streptococcus cristatus TaxID=45634 RepID=UPI0039C4C5BB